MNMKAKIITLSLVLVVAISIIATFCLPKSNMFLGNYDANSEMRRTELQNKSPYAIFGDSSQTLMTEQERTLKHTLEIENPNNEESASRLELNMQTGKVKLFDKKGSLISELLLQPDQLTRFMTIDRYAEKYYGLTPYQYAANNPIKFIDVNGDSIWVSTNTTVTNPDGTTSVQTNRYYYGQDANGNYGFIDPTSGNIYSGSDQFVGQVSTALGTLRQNSVGQGLVDNLMNSTNNTQIVQRGSNSADSQNGSYIAWNPTGTTGAPDQTGSTTRPAYIGLGHEMAHVQDVWSGTINHNPWVSVTLPNGTTRNIENAEIYATHMENRIRAEHGLSLRVSYAMDANGNYDPGTRIIQAGTSQSVYYDANGVTNYSPVISTQTPFTY
jgi:hypothetical protein